MIVDEASLGFGQKKQSEEVTLSSRKAFFLTLLIAKYNVQLIDDKK